MPLLCAHRGDGIKRGGVKINKLINQSPKRLRKTK